MALRALLKKVQSYTELTKYFHQIWYRYLTNNIFSKNFDSCSWALLLKMDWKPVNLQSSNLDSLNVHDIKVWSQRALQIHNFLKVSIRDHWIFKYIDRTLSFFDYPPIKMICQMEASHSEEKICIFCITLKRCHDVPILH